MSTLHSHTFKSEPRSLLTITEAKDRRSKKIVADALFDVSYKQGRDQGWAMSVSEYCYVTIPRDSFRDRYIVVVL